jgi:hypothetical protein
MSQNNIFDLLFAQFSDSDLEWKYWNYDQIDRGGDHRIVPHLKAMAVRKRLDGTLGIANWKQTCVPGGQGVVCSLSIRVDGEWITRDSYAELSANTAFVRAAADLGIGRYLYDLPILHANYVVADTEGAIPLEYRGQVFYHIPPVINKMVTPKKEESKPLKPMPQVNIDRPRFDQSPMGSKSQVEEIKKQQAGPAKDAEVLVLGVKTSRSTSVSKPAQAAPEQDIRPYAYDKLRFGYSKGKQFRDLSDSEWTNLIKWMNESLQFPTSKPVIEDRKKMLSFLNIKMQNGIIELPQKSQQA